MGSDDGKSDLRVRFSQMRSSALSSSMITTSPVVQVLVEHGENIIISSIHIQESQHEK
jgi:hypothetical protein